MKTKDTLHNEQGYSIVEIIIYVALLGVITMVTVSTIISFTRSYKDVMSLRVIEHSGINAMETITRNIRSAKDIDVAYSSLNTNPGILTLLIEEGGVATTKKFYTESGVIKADTNGTYFGPLTLQNVVVTNLVFTHMTSGISEAVKIDMTLSATVGTVTKTKTYHSTIILKGL